jgi:hypothetical protein
MTLSPCRRRLVGNLNRQWGKTASTFKPVNRHWNGPPSGLKRTRDPASCVWVVRLPGRCRCKVRCGAKRTAVKKSDSGLLRTRRHRPIDAKRELGSVHCHLNEPRTTGRRQTGLGPGTQTQRTAWTRLTNAGAGSLFRLDLQQCQQALVRRGEGSRSRLLCFIAASNGTPSALIERGSDW